MKRRDFLKQGLTYGAAVNALPLMMGGFPVRALGRSPLRSALRVQSGQNNNVLVIIQLQGGNDGLNCVVPYNDTNYQNLRGNGNYLTQTMVQNTILQDHNSLAFHPSLATNGGKSGTTQLPSWYDLYNDNKMAVLQNVGYPAPILSHFRGTDVWQTATDSSIYSSTGWIGRFLDDVNNGIQPTSPGSWPLAIQIGSALGNTFFSNAGGIGVAISRLPTASNNSPFNYDALPAPPLTNPEHELGYVRQIQLESDIYTQSLFKRSVTKNAITYPSGNTLATQLGYVAQCIASSGGATKVYLVTIGSFDTHSDQLNRQSTLFQELSAAVGAFQTDLEMLGLNENVAIMTYSEFGRRPAWNGTGTDHGTAAPHFIIGTKVNHGVQSHDPDLSSSVLSGSGNPEPGNMIFDSNYDFRNIYATVLSQWLMAGGTNNAAEVANVLTGGGAYSATQVPWNDNLPLFQGQTGVQLQPSTPGIMLLQNYPNPFTASTSIEYAIPAAGYVQISVYNIKGEEVARVVEESQSAGKHFAQFNAGSLPSGTYFYSLATGGAKVTQRMTIVK